MKRSKAAVVGAAETTQLGVIPNMSQIQLHADAALNAVRDAGISISDIDGIATAGESPEVARALSGHHANLDRCHWRRADAHSSCMFGMQRQP